MSRTGDRELAADLVQATCLAAFRSRRQLANRGAFAAWLFQIARNELRMEWRRNQHRRPLSLDLLPDAALARLGWTTDDESGPSVDRDQLQAALDRLSPPLREALILHGLCGFSGNELAELLGISPAAARKRIVRGAAACRAAVEADR